MTQPPPRVPAAHVERALCVLAHPDDVDFGSAGTVAGWVDAGIEVGYLLVTRGDAGGFDDTPRALMPASCGVTSPRRSAGSAPTGC